MTQLNINFDNKDDILKLLALRGDEQQQLFAQARAIRRQCGLEKVLMRGVIEVSSICERHCDYCAMRAPNTETMRYEMPVNEILQAINVVHAIPEISVCFLQSGQNPSYDAILYQAIPEIVKKFNGKIEILLNLGEKSKDRYQRYAELGAHSYILKFETSDPILYKKLTGSSLEGRLKCIYWIKEAGLKLGTGNITGIPGQTIDSAINDILLSKQLAPDFVSTAPFIPGVGTPLAHSVAGDVDLALNTIAILRIMLGNVWIPAVSALEKLLPGGQLMGLNAGANILTVNFSPEQRRQNYPIYDSEGRFIVKLDHAKNIANQAGLTIQQRLN